MEVVFYHWHYLDWLTHCDHKDRQTFSQFYYCFPILYRQCISLKTTPGAPAANPQHTTVCKYSLLWAYLMFVVGNKIKMTKKWNKSLGTSQLVWETVASWETKFLQKGKVWNPTRRLQKRFLRRFFVFLFLAQNSEDLSGRGKWSCALHTYSLLAKEKSLL